MLTRQPVIDLHKSFISAISTLPMNAEPATWLIAVGAAIAAVMFPSPSLQTAFWAGVGLIVLDTITALLAVWQSGAKIESAKARRGIAKIIGYASAFAVMGLAVRAVPSDLVPGGLTSEAHNVLFVVMLANVTKTEVVSILENLVAARVLSPRFANRFGAKLPEVEDDEE